MKNKGKVGAYSKRESVAIEQHVRKRDRLAPLNNVMAQRGRRGGATTAVRYGWIGNSQRARSLHAAHIRKYRYDPTLRQRTIKGNRHPETKFPQRPGYERTLKLEDEDHNRPGYERSEEGEETGNAICKECGAIFPVRG